MTRAPKVLVLAAAAAVAAAVVVAGCTGTDPGGGSVARGAVPSTTTPTTEPTPECAVPPRLRGQDIEVLRAARSWSP